MIKRVTGLLVEMSPTNVVVDVGGIGYGLSISLNTFDKLPDLQMQVSLYVYTYVREDRLELFGFSDSEEREMFELLISVSGIGPNSAQTILSGMSVFDLKSAIFDERQTDLTKVRGIGRKTADRIVIDLKDKISPLSISSSKHDSGSMKPVRTNKSEEAILALVALGIVRAVARKAVDSAIAKNGDSVTVQELIKQSLQER